MSRKKRVLRRPSIAPDKTFNSLLVSQITNRAMKDGKKTVAYNSILKALTVAAKELEVTEIEVLEKAVDNVKPRIEVKSMRVGGANYQVPMEPYPKRALSLSLRWIIKAARSIKGKPFWERLKTTLVQSYNNEGPAIATRTSVEQTAAGNKAFAHLAAWAKRKKTA